MHPPPPHPSLGAHVLLSTSWSRCQRVKWGIAQGGGLGVGVEGGGGGGLDVGGDSGREKVERLNIKI